jgi:hypothetical protein
MPRVALTAVLIAIVAVIIVALYIYLPRILVSSDQNYKVAMAGRSVTDQLFRRRALPSVLNKISIWRQWPIPYNKYIQDGVYYELTEIPAPTKNRGKPGYEYGGESYKIIESSVNREKYDTLVFESCFVEFDDAKLKNSGDVQNRLAEMTGLVKRIHGLAKARGMKFIVGNAMPSLSPSEHGQTLRRAYNQWLNDYALSEPDVVILDFFGLLADADGKLRKEYSLDLSDQDSHLNETADRLFGERLKQAVSLVRQ